ncbi:MAG: Arc family DNA-binding protein [Pseudomonas sp.]|nr:Arc family DNA-binding protein [Pseudomonas sp.]
MSRANPQVNFRMPQELKDKLESAAIENRRSITAELVARLENSFCENSPHNNPEVELLHKLYNESSAKLAELETLTSVGSMEMVELNSERATNTMLRHLLARKLSERPTE